jgi:hypothetical protein
VAVCADAILKVFRRSMMTILANCVVTTVGAACVLPLANQATTVRLTNVDLVTKTIEQHAEKSDLVIVDNCFYAISFHRYYHGKAPCLSVPDISDLSLHRWDLVKNTISQPRPIQSILDRIEQTLRSGNNVYVAGFAPQSHTESLPPDLAPAPQTASRWQFIPYSVRWTNQVAYTVQAHALRGMIIPVPCEQPVSEAERIRALVVSGWKEPTIATRQ